MDELSSPELQRDPNANTQIYHPTQAGRGRFYIHWVEMYSPRLISFEEKKEGNIGTVGAREWRRIVTQDEEGFKT